MGFRKIPAAGGAFFFCAWLTMVFWSIVAPSVGVKTIDYKRRPVAHPGAPRCRHQPASLVALDGRGVGQACKV